LLLKFFLSQNILLVYYPHFYFLLLLSVDNVFFYVFFYDLFVYFFLIVLFLILYFNSNTKYVMRKSTFHTIGNNYKTFEELQAGLREAGLESSNIIVGVDFTKSNLWTGQKTFAGNSLHAVMPHCLNPYQTVISILGRTLSSFDDDNLIPAYGFGDKTTTDKKRILIYS